MRALRVLGCWKGNVSGSPPEIVVNREHRKLHPGPRGLLDPLRRLVNIGRPVVGYGYKLPLGLLLARAFHNRADVGRQ